jgi:hypothetical protein
MWEDKVEPDRPQMTNIIRRVRLACWITRAANINLEYVKLVVFHGNIGYANVPQCNVMDTFILL